ncbi:hypothetical protein PINS_up001198 [Pythium insidiosum]|nr:hypothetical protein PINS_up001198 [Pythium insidiosum]
MSRPVIEVYRLPLRDTVNDGGNGDAAGGNTAALAAAVCAAAAADADAAVADKQQQQPEAASADIDASQERHEVIDNSQSTPAEAPRATSHAALSDLRRTSTRQVVLVTQPSRRYEAHSVTEGLLP